MAELYPLKFKPQYRMKLWGGSKFKSYLNRTDVPEGKAGESWEISGVAGQNSEVSNGFLEGNTLEEVIEIYMDEIVGEKIFDTFGHEFPLLIKFIEANDNLSIQVHPDDELSKERHNSFGKTEMWYVLDAEPDAQLIVGFKENSSKDAFIEHFAQGKVDALLNAENVQKGDVYFIPAGRVHAIGKGMMVAEIQQTSDITYRIYDWDRTEADGTTRELHVDMALDAIDYTSEKKYKSTYTRTPNVSNKMVSCNYFTTNYISLTTTIEKDYNEIDSFVIYMCVGGSFTIICEGEKTDVAMGETVLIPAALKELTFIPSPQAELLEVYI